MLDHRRDLMADFRAFYHLDPASALRLGGPEWLALAWRTPAYGGAMAARLDSAERPATSAPAGNAPPARTVPLGTGARALAPDADGLPLGDLFD